MYFNSFFDEEKEGAFENEYSTAYKMQNFFSGRRLNSKDEMEGQLPFFPNYKGMLKSLMEELKCNFQISYLKDSNDKMMKLLTANDMKFLLQDGRIFIFDGGEIKWKISKDSLSMNFKDDDFEKSKVLFATMFGSTRQIFFANDSERNIRLYLPDGKLFGTVACGDQRTPSKFFLNQKNVEFFVDPSCTVSEFRLTANIFFSNEAMISVNLSNPSVSLTDFVKEHCWFILQVKKKAKSKTTFCFPSIWDQRNCMHFKKTTMYGTFTFLEENTK